MNIDRAIGIFRGISSPFQVHEQSEIARHGWTSEEQAINHRDRINAYYHPGFQAVATDHLSERVPPKLRHAFLEGLRKTFVIHAHVAEGRKKPVDAAAFMFQAAQVAPAGHKKTAMYESYLQRAIETRDEQTLKNAVMRLKRNEITGLDEQQNQEWLVRMRSALAKASRDQTLPARRTKTD